MEPIATKAAFSEKKESGDSKNPLAELAELIDLLFRTKSYDHYSFSSLNPDILSALANHLPLPKHNRMLVESRERCLETASYLTHWLQNCFPEFQIESQGKKPLPPTDSFEVRNPLTQNHAHLCLGCGKKEWNSRKHDPETCYTLDLSRYSDSDVVDNIILLPTRQYLNRSDGTPHQFEKIYIEVSESPVYYLSPAFMKFLHDHLKPGGYLYVEIGGIFLNESLNALPEAFARLVPLQSDRWPYHPSLKKVFETPIDQVTCEFDLKDGLKISSYFRGDWKKFFESCGFEKIQLSDIKKCQAYSVPVEMVKSH